MNKNDSAKTVIAERLRLAREMAGLSQTQVAKMLGIQRPSVSEFEAGRRKVSAEELSNLARIYDVSIAWLTGTENNSSDPVEARVALVARELSKLKPDDLNRLLELLKALRTTQDD